ncbi:MAG TPA: class I SAM-dependent methyltransferase [Candidatus Paceibacterota bacterium]|nr:class I SAM-dependent methyltransferase [Candidatus Paceibacterota bacterium]
MNTFSSFLKRTLKQGIGPFFKKLIQSKFGLSTALRNIQKYFKRKELINNIRKGNGGAGIDFRTDIGGRDNLAILLSAPAKLIDEEVKALQTYAAKSKGDLVEIGCAYGASTLALLISKKLESKLTSIDPFIKDSMGEFQADEEECRQKVSKALRDIGLGDTINSWELVPDYSFNHVKEFTSPIGFIFIDGDHTYEAVKQDFEEWFPLVEKSGYIAFHDSARPIDATHDKWENGWPGPSRLVREIRERGDLELVEQVKSLSVFQKK